MSETNDYNINKILRNRESKIYNEYDKNTKTMCDLLEFNFYLKVDENKNISMFELIDSQIHDLKEAGKTMIECCNDNINGVIKNTNYGKTDEEINKISNNISRETEFEMFSDNYSDLLVKMCNASVNYFKFSNKKELLDIINNM